MDFKSTVLGMLCIAGFVKADFGTQRILPVSTKQSGELRHFGSDHHP